MVHHEWQATISFLSLPAIYATKQTILFGLPEIELTFALQLTPVNLTHWLPNGQKEYITTQ